MPAPPVSIGRYYPDSAPAQTPSDVAVVMPTLLRPELPRALRSIYDQDFKGRIQIMIGVDVAQGELDDYESVFAERPDNVSILIITLPYSTSTRHGGLHAPKDGGSLRTILGYAANARYVAFLDDDNTYLPNHISALHGVIEGRVWASGQRILVDQDTDEHLAVDIWDSVGPDRGRFKDNGGFIDPNCLMVDKMRVGVAFAQWSRGPGVTSDRAFFRALAGGKYTMVMTPTVLYRLRKTNMMRDLIRDNPVF
jgi:glycosyltransferase involved in cell wall biosynthesis